MATCGDNTFLLNRTTTAAMSKLELVNSQAPENVVFLQADALDACRTLSTERFKLVVTSPPYNIGKSYEQKTGLQAYLDNMEPLLIELTRVTHAQGNLIWQVGNYVQNGEVFPLDIFFYPLLHKLGWQLRNRIIWHFDHGLHASKRLSGRYETLLWFSKTNDYTFNLDPIRVPSKYPGKLHYKGAKKGLPSGNPLGKNPSDYWGVINQEWAEGVMHIPNVKSNHPEKTNHPCQFPIELVERCVLALTNVDDWVLDPFGGVGSSLIAAVEHRRQAVIIEREPRYLNQAQARYADWQAGTLKKRPLGKPVHQPNGREKITQRPTAWDDPEST